MPLADRLLLSLFGFSVLTVIGVLSMLFGEVMLGFVLGLSIWAIAIGLGSLMGASSASSPR
jgi:hypothetical protein